MKKGVRPSIASTMRRPMLGLCILVPFLMGGCPEYRNEVVGVLEAATVSVLFGTEDAAAISQTARQSLVDATIDLVFDQLRSGTTN